MDTLYHYCSTSAFHAIVSTRSVRLSSLSLSNDTLEGKLVADAISRLAKRDGLDANTCDRLQKYLDHTEKLFDGLGFCLSEDGDVLSQWRGYAADATGVAIGFSHEYLEWLAEESRKPGVRKFTVSKVKYEPAEHEEEVSPTYTEIRRLIDAGAFRFAQPRGLLDLRTDEEFEAERRTLEQVHLKLSMALVTLFPKLYLLKARAFREEREWRLLTYALAMPDEPLSYSPLPDRLIPIRSYELSKSSHHAIRDVVLGPKHLTPTTVVDGFMKRNGFDSASVRRSEASYR